MDLVQRALTTGLPAPVEYAVAVDQYLSSAALSEPSRRVYRISLAGWAWSLAGRPQPTGPRRRGASPPIIPLALLDDIATSIRLAEAVAARSAQADVRTINREVAALRSAAGWWLEQGWITRDPTIGVRALPETPAAVGPLTEQQVTALFDAKASLREQAFWHLLYDSGSNAPAALRLDAGTIDRRGRPRAHAALAGWGDATSELLTWLLSGRTIGPVFLTDRRASRLATTADRCPLTGRARMSYRRAAEIFAATTSRLDPCGRSWTLHQLRRTSP